VGLGTQLHTSFAVFAVLSLLLWLTGTVRIHWGVFAAARVRRGVVVWTVVAVLLVVAITFGAPMYRQGGRRAVVLDMRHDHPLFHELGLVRHGSVTTDSDAPDAWWPNGLEPEPDDD
jgi:hypothetical protein